MWGNGFFFVFVFENGCFEENQRKIALSYQIERETWIMSIQAYCGRSPAWSSSGRAQSLGRSGSRKKTRRRQALKTSRLITHQEGRGTPGVNKGAFS